MMSNTNLTAAHRVGAYAKLGKLALMALAMMFGLAVAQPALAQFSSQEGYASGAPHWTFEAQPYLWLPATTAKVGLARAPGLDLSGTFHPTLANVIGSLNAAVTCDCLVRYGDFSGEFNLSYISLSGTKGFPPILPGQPQRRLNGSVKLFLISPGLGYRIYHNDKVSFDARVGFSYSQVDANARFLGSPLAERDGVSTSFIQPWIGERFDYYPTPKWRIENATAITGLGVDGGAIGWNTHIGVSYLITTWLDTSIGYAASQTERSNTPGPNGQNNSVNILNYGPYLAFGFRF
jgi:hypothetical protein